MSRQVRIYGCGGCGVNIAHNYLEDTKVHKLAKIYPGCIETSKSNHKSKLIPESDSYFIEGLDGSGKIRSSNHQAISENIKQALIKIPPMDFNVAIFSASGGSGSVIGPLLISELNKRDIPVIAIVVGTTESAQATDNTFKLFKSLEGVAKATDVPVIMSYFQNSQDQTRDSVDQVIYSYIAAIAVLCNGENDELDYSDLKNWLQYTKVNGDAAQLATMRIAVDQAQVDSIKYPVSVASLYKDTSITHISVDADYVTTGYGDLNDDFSQIHYVITTDEIVDISENIFKIKDSNDQKREAKPRRKSTLAHGTPSTDDGLFL